MIPLAVEGLSVNFGGLQAVDNVALQVEEGERRAIIGTNGAGKTTLFNLINGQIAATAGRILLFGEDITRLPPHRRAALGLARTFQITNLFPALTVLDNMLIAVQALDPCHFVFFRRLESYSSVQHRAREILERWDLWPLRDEPVRTLAYGMQRKLEIVLALAGRPRVLLLDEPMAGLSAQETDLAGAIIRNLDRSITVLLIEHDLTAAFAIADRITAMDQGRIVAEGTPEEIRKESRLAEIYMRGAAQGPRS
jgi:branched-chain amino acid transport system ATP-binding protein